MNKLINEFKEFAVKGNVIDMAVGIIIGGAFGKIVSSFVSDIIMPPIGMIIGKVDFKDLAIEIQQASETTAAVSINYGSFIQTVIDFVIIAFVIFMAIKGINNLKQKKEEKAAIPPIPPKPSNEEVLLTEIRDLLKNK